MEFRAGAHMGEKKSKRDGGSCSPKNLYKKSKRLVISYGNSKIFKTSNSNSSSNSSSSNNKRSGSIWLRH